MRKLVEKAVKQFSGRSSKTVVFVAPTGYGKTEAAPYAFKRSGMPRAVHVTPMRTLVKTVYEKWLRHTPFLGLDSDDVGWQYMSGFSYGKSPYFIRRAVATTFDSFLYNLMKLPVARIGEGTAHYELPRSAIASSFIVFDEAHLYGGDPGQPDAQMFSAFLAAYAAVAENPVLIITATLPRCVVEAVEEEARRIGADYSYIDYEEERDDEYEGWLERNFSIETHVVDSLDEVPGNVFSKRALFVFNTVEKAVEFYKKIRGGGVVLIHGRFAWRDREAKEEALRSAKIVVSTQVVEVGVDIDSDVVVTDVAPVTSLVQRAGRACRRGGSSKRKCEIYVVRGDGDGVYNREVVKRSVEAVDGIDWKHPREAIEKVYSGCDFAVDNHARTLLRELDARLILGLSEARQLLRYLCERGRGLARGTLMMPVYIGANPQNLEKELILPVGMELAYSLMKRGARLIPAGRNCPDDLCGALLRGCAALHYPNYDSELGLI